MNAFWVMGWLVTWHYLTDISSNSSPSLWPRFTCPTSSFIGLSCFPSWVTIYLPLPLQAQVPDGLGQSHAPEPTEMIQTGQSQVCSSCLAFPAETTRKRDSMSSSSYKGTNSIKRSPPSWPHLNLIIPQRIHLQISSYCKFRVLINERGWGVGTSMQSIPSSKLNLAE